MQAIKIYSMRVAMLCRLYDLKLINDKEYTKIKNRIENDEFLCFRFLHSTARTQSNTIEIDSRL